MCDAAGLSVPALLAGVFWPCSEFRAGAFGSRRCLCGHKSTDAPRPLTLHFCFGPCTCAADARREWKRRVADAFRAHSRPLAIGSMLPSYELLARWLGNGGRDLPRELAWELPRIFSETIGSWAAAEPRARAEGLFTARTAAGTAGAVAGTGAAAGMFLGASAFDQPIGDWSVDKVTDMCGMFAGASAFNQPIGGWSVDEVTDMCGMFYYASAFNQPIGDWRVDKVTCMWRMFRDASSFNQQLGEWRLGAWCWTFQMFGAGHTSSRPVKESCCAIS